MKLFKRLSERGKTETRRFEEWSGQQSNGCRLTTFLVGVDLMTSGSGGGVGSTFCGRRFRSKFAPISSGLAPQSFAIGQIDQGSKAEEPPELEIPSRPGGLFP